MLAKLDDVVIDLVIDQMQVSNVNFAATARKTTEKYSPLGRVSKKIVSQILQDTKPFDIDKIQHKILQVDCLEKCRVPNGRSNPQSKWFNKQLRSYLQIYNTKCRFKIAESEHLSGIDREAAVFATKPFKRGEIIQFLSGVCVPLTEEEVLQLEASGKDFSLIDSPCSKNAMFLGPARFVNHDCKANSLIVRPARSLTAQIVALKHIRKGEEITVFYGKHYFGKNNQACLCQSCSTARRS